MGTLILVDDEVPVSCEYITSVAQASPNVSQPLSVGDADAGVVAVIVNYSVAASQNGEITGATIDGETAAILAQQVFDRGGVLSDPGVAIIIAQIEPAGSTVVVTLTTSADITAAFSSYRIENLLDLAAVDTAGYANNPSGGSISINLDTPSDGVLLVGANIFHAGDISISGVSEDYMFAGVDTYRFGGHDLTTAQTGLGITVARTSGAASLGAVSIAAVSLR